MTRRAFLARLYTPMNTLHKISALAAASVALTAFGADAATNWKEHCAKCHGDAGKGDTKMGRKLSIADLTDPAVQAKFTDEAAIKAMKEGVKDKSDKQTMKPVENVSAEEMTALVAHVRALKK
jgi:cytochrome c553